MPEKQKENIKNKKLTKVDKAKLLAEIKNIIKKADEQNRALGVIIKKIYRFDDIISVFNKGNYTLLPELDKLSYLKIII